MLCAPGLILAVEWPRERFSALVGLAVATNQFTFAFGPSLLEVLRDRVGTYGPALDACAALQVMAAGMILFGLGRAQRIPKTRATSSTSSRDKTSGAR